MTTHTTWSLINGEGLKFGDVIGRLHMDFVANAKYISFFIPQINGIECPEAFMLNKIAEILQLPETQFVIQAGIGAERTDARQLIFTGQIYLYSERPVPDDIKARLINEGMNFRHKLTFRSVEYVDERSKWEKPLAFISHDSRDKADIAEPIALQLQKLMCPVWYDQFSLRVRDSLRESIEAGLKECHKCILVLTSNFLNNDGWSKREYDSIFTREIVEKQKVILPVWHNISAQEVYRFSPILADRVAAQWSGGVDEVARKLLTAIMR